MSEIRPAMSVLMAVYNTPHHYLDEAIQSILLQSFADFEFLIIDDGSEETTRERLREHASSDSRIRLHCLPSNIGLTRALNVGLRLVRGAYIARQDADDVSHPARLAETLRFLESNEGLAAAGTQAHLIGPTGQHLGEMSIDPELLRMPKRNVLVHGSMIFRREVFDRINGYDERMRLSQDYELYLRMIRLHGMRLGVVPAVLYSLRQHSDSLSSRRMFRQLYFSVLAKSLTFPGRAKPWRRKIFFVTEFIQDLVVTHRLLLGPVLRRYSLVKNRADKAVRPNQ